MSNDIRVGSGIRIIKMPRRFSIPIIRKYYYWKLKKKLEEAMKTHVYNQDGILIEVLE